MTLPAIHRHAWLTLFVLGASSGAMQQPERRVEPAAIPVRYSEGMVHGFLKLETADGKLLAHGDLLQVPKTAASRAGWSFTSLIPPCSRKR